MSPAVTKTKRQQTLDNFKEINDEYGHKIGDEALRFVANLTATT